MPEHPSIERGLSLLVVDDHRVFADLMTFALAGLPSVAQVTTASSAAAAAERLATESFDVVVLDAHLPDGSGVDLVPEALVHRGTRALVLTGHPRRGEAARALALGASAYLAKDGALSTLTEAVELATPDAPHVTPRFPEDELAGGSLTERERQVLMRIVDGDDATRIAADLSLSVLTVRDHIKSLLAKLGVCSQLEAVALASQAGLSAQTPR